MGFLASTWGIIGVLALLIIPIARLFPIAMDVFNHELLWYHWLSLGANTLFMGYSEGYKGFHRSFAPRVAARALVLWRNPRPLHALLGPLFCLGFLHTTRTRKIRVYALTAMIIGFIYLAQALSQPWRGILDAGVVVGLTFGSLSLLYWLGVACTAERFSVSPELPSQEYI